MSGADINLLPDYLIFIKYSLPEVIKLFHRLNLFALHAEKSQLICT